MSRRALEHEEARVGAPLAVPRPPEIDPPGALPIYGNRLNANMNPVLFTNIQSSSYFKERCAELETIDDIIDEIYTTVEHLEPFLPGPRNSPSTAFCLIYRLFCLRPTERDMLRVLNHKDSIYIRAIGFLYLRFTAPPQELWDWFFDYIDEPTPLKVKMGARAPQQPLGKFLRELLQDMKYFTTRFPRIPVLKAKEISDYISTHPYNPKAFEEGYPEEAGGKQGSSNNARSSPRRSRSPPRRRSRSRSPRRRRSRSRSPRRGRDRSPRRRSRSPRRRRSRSRSPRRRRSRSRSRSPRRRSRSPSRHSKSRDRSRERSSKSRDRDRSRERSSKHKKKRRHRSSSRD